MPSAGELTLPAEWQWRTESHYLGPPRTISVPLAGRPQQSAYRPQLMVARWRESGPTAAEHLDALMRDLAPDVTQLRRLDSGVWRFTDGVEGPYVTIAFAVGAEPGVVQCHLVRLDGDVVTHLSATVAAMLHGTIASELLPLLGAFLPSR
jgi:hypothetical protein